MINTHRGLANRLRWAQDALALTGADVVLHKAPLISDVSIWELLWPLISGATLVIAPPGAHRDPAALVAIIEAEQVTTCHFVPTMLRAFLDVPGLAARCGSLRQVVASGEALGRELVERYHAELGAALHALYGPTEAASDVTWWPCVRDDVREVVPLGRAIEHVQLYARLGHGGSADGASLLRVRARPCAVSWSRRPSIVHVPVKLRFQRGIAWPAS